MTSMHIVTLCLVLIALTCLASILRRVLKVPLPFLQIAIGIIAALPPFGLKIPLDPNTFLLLFLPLHLFGDGWRLPRRGLTSMPWSVIGHAVGLVVLTTIAGGYALHRLIPEMPLSVAFAIAALLSPTDAVAVSGITNRLPVPAAMKNLIESESLLNDASGLVAMRIAIAATVSGSFSLFAATSDFVWVGLAGSAIGGAIALVYHLIHRRFLRDASDATLQTVLIGLLPFAAFVAAEEVGASGIIAAVAAGIAASRLSLLEHAHVSARIMTGITWDVVSFCLNGIIFVLLGLQLPGIIGPDSTNAEALASLQRWEIGKEILEFTVLLIALRCLWIVVPLAVRWALGRGSHFGGWKTVAASSIAGVRGAVTLAGALSIPLQMPDGTPFPYRDFAITIAVGVILLSMLIAAVGLPFLLRGMNDDHVHIADLETLVARHRAIDAAIHAISSDANAGPGHNSLIAGYFKRQSALRDEAVPTEDQNWKDLHVMALVAERGAIQKLRQGDEIDDTVARKLLHELDFLEAAIAQRSPAPPGPKAS